MNYLAHILLSKSSPEYQLGNLLADPLKGKGWPGISEGYLAGMKMHALIDSYTDAHTLVSRSKARLGEKGYLKGVVVDVVYDHFLTKHWHKFVTLALDDFVAQFERNSSAVLVQLPAPAALFVGRIFQYKVLLSYGELSGVRQALTRIDSRLSARIQKKETASTYMPVLEQNYSAIEQDFLEFFPQLMALFRDKNTGLEAAHYLKPS
ncbi:Acyl carrier protein phosphodiesterase [Alteromonadaceae bacterium Bs31]|nr:Acyl carrier protein phosphodiesterase [Alteromonadaceae bacterium Bs31]